MFSPHRISAALLHVFLFTGRTHAAAPDPAVNPIINPLINQGDPTVNVTAQGVVGDGKTNVAIALQSLLSGASAGQTFFFPQGDYVAPAGTIIYIDKPVKLLGSGANLVNIRLFFLADPDVDGLSFTEVDCVHDQRNPGLCPVAGAMITAGYVGYPLSNISIRNVNLSTTRAYTAIEFGYDRVASATLDHFSIVDHELSAISIYGGTHIRITNGTIVGGGMSGAEGVVDDGIALSPYYGPISDVTISNVNASQTADLVGMGSDLFWPLTQVSILQSSCDRTLVCLYFRLGDVTPPPAPYAQYSYLDGITVDGILDLDPNGVRYQASVMFVARGGAVGRNISISNVSANSRAASPYGFRVQAFLDGGSTLQNVLFENCRFDDSLIGVPNNPAAPNFPVAGFPVAEGIYLQTDSTSSIDGLILSNLHVSGTAYWGIDAGNARVSNLQMINPDFTNVFLTQPGWSGPLVYIPGSSVANR